MIWMAIVASAHDRAQRASYLQVEPTKQPEASHREAQDLLLRRQKIWIRVAE